MMLRSPEGATYVAGLVRAAGVPRDAGAKMQPVNVVVQAVDAQGRTSAQKERLVNGEFAEDGSVMASYGMTLRPGKYTLNVAVLDPKSGKGSVAAIPVDVPDLSEGELDVMPLVLLQSIEEGGATPDPKDPMSDFVLGTNRLHAVVRQRVCEDGHDERDRRRLQRGQGSGHGQGVRELGLLDPEGRQARRQDRGPGGGDGRRQPFDRSRAPQQLRARQVRGAATGEGQRHEEGLYEGRAIRGQVDRSV